MIKNERDKSTFFQWDRGQKIRIWHSDIEIATQVHFACPGDRTNKALVVDIEKYDGVIYADVPDILLQYAGKIFIYLYCHDDGGYFSVPAGSVTVLPREKPDDYVYVEPENGMTWTEIKERMNYLEAVAEQADENADDAKAVANEAKTAASRAENKAGAALDSANNAKTTADNAKKAANEAKLDAENAMDAAELAIEKAEEAMEAAGNAGGASKNVWYGISDNSEETYATNRTVTTDTEDFKLETGNILFVRFTNFAGSNVYTINVDGLGATPVSSKGTSGVPEGAWEDGEIVGFVFDGERLRMIEGAPATTLTYGMVRLSDKIDSAVNSGYAATPLAVKKAYDLANKANVETVKFTEDQELPDDQKMIARNNIGAVDVRIVTWEEND